MRVGLVCPYSWDIPGGVQAGDWFYWSRARDDCSGAGWLSRETVRESANIPVSITNPTPAAPMQVVTQPGPVTILPTSAN